MNRATITTRFESPTVAARVAAAVCPDNTDEMSTRVQDDRVVTTIERETTGGLRSTVNDYVVNCTVAARLAAENAAGGLDRANTPAGDPRPDGDAAASRHTTTPKSTNTPNNDTL